MNKLKSKSIARLFACCMVFLLILAALFENTKLEVNGATDQFVPIWPVNAYRINALDRYSSGETHNGIDIAVSSGSNVKAVAAGKVINVYNSCTHVGSGSNYCECNGGYGNYIELEHTSGGKTYHSRYGHLLRDSIVVSKGSTVSEGQKIAQSGSSGSSTGPHLHLEVFEGSRTSDKARKTFQFYRDNAYLIDGATFSSHVPTSSEFFGWWVKQNCSYTNGVYKFTHWKHNCVDMGSTFTATLLHPASGYGIANINGNAELGVTGTAATQWNFSKNSDGSYFITSVVDGKALEINGSDKVVDGANIGTFQLYETASQKWFIMQNGSYYSLIAAASGKTLDVTEGRTTLGTNVQLWPSNGTNAQQINIVIGNTSDQTTSQYERAIFPAPRVYLTQIAYESYSHGEQNAIDISPGGNVFAPFSGKIVYVDSNWGYVVLQSLDKVYYADGTLDYMTVGFMHDENISDLSVGKTIAQGTAFYQAGGMGDGNPDAYGDHVHITVHKGKVTRGYPYGNGDTYAYNAFFVDGNKTTIQKAGKVESGNSVYNGAPSDWSNLWKDLAEFTNAHIKQFYPAHCTIELAKSSSVKSMPCSVDTDPESKTIESYGAGTTYTAIGLCRNDATSTGNLWYKVIAKTGEIGYIYAGDTKLGADNILRIVSDLKVTDVSAPTELTQGKSFSIKGVINTDYQKLTKVGAVVINTATGKQETGTVLSVDATSYDLLNSNVDYAVKFNNLPVGNYEYRIVASVKSYYAESATKEATFTTAEIVLHKSTFSVVASTSCSHSYSTSVTAPTCTAEGYTTYTCKACGYSYKGSYTAAKGHSYGNWVTVTAATCTKAGQEKSTCSSCGNVKTQTVAAGGHQYAANKVAATCTEYAKTVYTCSGCGDSYTKYDESQYSQWSTIKPSGIADKWIESRTEYRYRTKEYTTGTTSTMDGWNLKDTTSQWSEYGAWSGWSDTAVTASDTVKVEKRTVYAYYFYKCSHCGAHMHGYGSCYTWAGGCGKSTSSADWNQIWSTTSWDNAGLKDWHGTGKYYTNIDGLLVFKHTSGGSKTQYRSCARTLETVYNFWRWSDWSSWQTTAVEATDECAVETRTVYRYLNSGLAAHTEVIDKAVAATCTTAGKTEGRHCSVCNTVIVAQTTVAATGHSYTYKATKNPTTSATGTLTGTCSACSGTTTVSLPKLNTTDYSYQVTKAATCTATGTGKYTWKTTTYGSFSFSVTIAATGHTEVTDAAVAATCTTAGKTEGKHCSVCNTVIVAQTTVAAKGHTEVIDKAVAATCTTSGKTEGKHCSVCNAIIVAQTTVAAKGHTEVIDKAVAATCTTAGKTEGKHCSVCNTVIVAQTTISATGHSYTYKATKNPTTAATGTLTGTCSHCSGTTTVSLPKLNTTDYSYQVTKAATCTATGTGKYTWKTTTYGSFSFAVTIAATGHTEVIDAAMAATCTTTGKTEGKHCSVCNAVIVAQTIVAAKGHTEVIDKAVAATCTTAGKKEGSHCSTCNKILVMQEEIPAVGHFFENGICAICGENNCIASGTCGAQGDNLRWMLDEDGTLTISGTGAMQNYSSTSMPWRSYLLSIKNIILSDGIETIGSSAFSSCRNLITVTIPDTVYDIGWYAFSGCSKLQTITIPAKVKSIGSQTFLGCSALTSVYLHENIYTIGSEAFLGSGVTSIYISKNVTSIGTGAFQQCQNLTGIWVSEDNTQYASDANGVLFNKSKTNLIQAPGSLTGKYTIPNTVTSINQYAFSYCEKLSTIEILANVSTIENYTFQNCSNLTAVVLPDSLQKIGNRCFSKCSSLRTITIPDSVTAMDYYAFEECSSLENVCVGEGVTTLSRGVFYNCVNLQSVTIPSNVTKIIDLAFCGCNELTDVYYQGTPDQWNAISIGSDNSALTNAVRHYHSHNFTTDSIIESTCTNTGSVVMICQCGKTQTEAIPAKGHTEVIDKAVAATCTTSGKTEGKHCSVCNTVIVAQSTVAAKGHTEVIDKAVAATCTTSGKTEGKHCSVCNTVLTAQQTVPATGHSYSYKTTKTPTTSATGTLTGTCSKCSGTTTVSLPKLNTTDYSYQVTKDATCTATGTGKYAWKTTTYGSFSFSVTIAATGHTEVTDAAVAATCTTAGKTEGKHCSVCNTVIVAQQTIAAKGHTEVIDKAVAATCTTSGKTEGKHCSVCNTVIVAQTTVAAKGHTKVTDAAVAATCTTAGKTEGKHCSVCNAIIVAQSTVAAKGHTEVIDKAVAATCTTAGKTEGKHCSVCNTVIVAQTTVAAKGHTEVIDKAVAVTCTTSGKTEGKHCSVCNTVIVAQTTVAAKGHTEVIDKAVAATCTTSGKTEGKHCSVCNAIIVAQTTVAAKGHTEVIDKAVAATCTTSGKTEGKHCSVCNTVIVAQTTVAAKGHTEVTDAAVAATCTTAGKTEGKHCSVCGTVLVAQQTIPASNHNYAITPEVKPTCTKPGMTSGVQCTDCGTYLLPGNEIPALGHIVVINPAVDATCNTPGKTEGSHCSVCNEILVAQQDVPATSHSYAITPEVKPTCTEPGYASGVQCTLCKEYLLPATEVPALGHTEVVDAAIAPTCTIPGLTQGKHCSTCGAVLLAQEVIPVTDHVYDSGVCTGCQAVGVYTNVGGKEQYYFTLTEALTSSGDGYAQLCGNVTENVVVATDANLDLNGFSLTGNVTIADGATLYVFDSATSDYTAEKRGKIIGGITGNLARSFNTPSVYGHNYKYLALEEEENVWSFHRYYLSVKSVILVPYQRRDGYIGTAMDYKTAFKCNELVARYVASYGTKLTGEQTVYVDCLGSIGDLKAGVSNQCRTWLSGTMKNTNTAAQNAANSEKTVGACAYILLTDGFEIGSVSVDMSLRQLIAEASKADGFTPVQKAAFAQMYKLFCEVIDLWQEVDLEALKRYASGNLN